MTTVAVIVAAYRTSAWIGECVESIRAQVLPPDTTMELRIGTDGCEDTSATLTALGVSHWHSPANVGAYVIRNSLMAQSRADYHACFDADDRMRPDYLAKLTKLATPKGIAGSGRISIDEQGLPKTGRTLGYVWGIAVYSEQAMGRLGGFRPWRMAADSDLILRAKAQGIPVRAHREALFERRVHPESLTQRQDTGMKSEARLKLKAEGARLVAKGQLWVQPVTTELEYRGA